MAREMKDSGIPWIGEIPSSWDVMPHKWVMHKEKDIQEHYQGQNILSLTMKGVIVRDLDAGGKMPTTFDGYQIVHPNDLLQCLFDIDVTPRCVGLVKDEGVTSPAYSRFVMCKNAYSPYYDYLLRYLDDNKVLLHLSKNLRSSLTETDFGAIETCVPSIPEQKAIADFLDKKCAEIDEMISLQEKIIEELKAYKQSVITEAVTDGLNSNTEYKPSTIEWVDRIPSHWKEVRFYKICYIRGRLGWKGLKAEEYVETGYPFLSAFNIINDKVVWEDLNFITKERYDESPEIKLSVGDLIIVKDGAGIGKCAVIDNLPLGESTVNSSLAVITPLSHIISEYLYFYFLSKPFQEVIWQLKIGMGVPHLTQENMHDIVVTCPPIEEQQRICMHIKSKCSDIDSLISLKLSKIDSLREYKKSIIYEYVTGKKEVEA